LGIERFEGADKGIVRVIATVRFLILSIPLFLGSALLAVDKGFQPGPAASYAHQSADQITVGAKPYDNEDLTQDAFGKKADPLRYGILPVLVVIENKSDKSLDLRSLEVNIVASDGRHATAMDPDDLSFVGRNQKKPSISPPPIPLPKKKNPLTAPEITARAFAAKMLPPGETASGFFYFEAKAEAGDKLYLNGLRDARSGRGILFFEFPLSGQSAP
jgi:hypothetical protein